MGTTKQMIRSYNTKKVVLCIWEKKKKKKQIPTRVRVRVRVCLCVYIPVGMYAHAWITIIPNSTVRPVLSMIYFFCTNCVLLRMIFLLQFESLSSFTNYIFYILHYYSIANLFWILQEMHLLDLLKLDLWIF